jgi:hypothetical protein
MKRQHFNATERNTDFLWQEIGTDNMDTYLNNLIEQDRNGRGFNNGIRSTRK